MVANWSPVRFINLGGRRFCTISRPTLSLFGAGRSSWNFVWSEFLGDLWGISRGFFGHLWGIFEQFLEDLWGFSASTSSLIQRLHFSLLSLSLSLSLFLRNSLRNFLTNSFHPCPDSGPICSSKYVAVNRAAKQAILLHRTTDFVCDRQPLTWNLSLSLPDQWPLWHKSWRNTRSKELPLTGLHSRPPQMRRSTPC